jgi:hypothetical protein
MTSETMWVFYTFSSNFCKAQAESFLEGKQLNYELIEEDNRLIIEINRINGTSYLRFNYTDSEALIANSLHDLVIIPILRNLKDKNCSSVKFENDEIQN